MISNIISTGLSTVSVFLQRQNSMNNQFERAVRNKLDSHNGELDPVTLSQITSLRIEHATQGDLDDLFLTPSLINLSLDCEGDINLNPIGKLPLLDTFEIRNANIEDFSPLNNVNALRNLDVDNSQIASFHDIRLFENLDTLRLRN